MSSYVLQEDLTECARSDYLTGFHKRKVAKIEEKRKRAKELAHAEHLANRRKAREELKRKAAENFKVRIITRSFRNIS